MAAGQLENFTHKVQAVACRGCSNNCRLTINTFNDGRRFIGGNRCEKPLANYTQSERYDLYDYKRELLEEYVPKQGFRGKIGIPMGLNMFELLPFWHTFLLNWALRWVTRRL